MKKELNRLVGDNALYLIRLPRHPLSLLLLPPLPLHLFVRKRSVIQYKSELFCQRQASQCFVMGKGGREEIPEILIIL